MKALPAGAAPNPFAIAPAAEFAAPVPSPDLALVPFTPKAAVGVDLAKGKNETVVVVVYGDDGPPDDDPVSVRLSQAYETAEWVVVWVADQALHNYRVDLALDRFSVGGIDIRWANMVGRHETHRASAFRVLRSQAEGAQAVTAGPSYIEARQQHGDFLELLVGPRAAVEKR